MNGSTIDNSGRSVEKTAQARLSRTKSLRRKKISLRQNHLLCPFVYRSGHFRKGEHLFTLAHLLDSYRNKPDMTWTNLSSCYAEERQLAFEVMYGRDAGWLYA